MSISIRHVETSSGRDIAIVSLPSRLDAAVVPQVSQDFAAMAGDRAQRIILNMANVTFLDSSGLGLMVSVLKQCRAGGGNCCLCCLSPEVASTLDLTALDTIFSYFLNVDAAIADFPEPPNPTADSIQA